jgi:hypothetical protein
LSLSLTIRPLQRVELRRPDGTVLGTIHVDPHRGSGWRLRFEGFPDSIVIAGPNWLAREREQGTGNREQLKAAVDAHLGARASTAAPGLTAEVAESAEGSGRPASRLPAGGGQ